MRIDEQDPESGRKFSGVANGLDENIINDFFNSFNLSDEEIRSGLPVWKFLSTPSPFCTR